MFRKVLRHSFLVLAIILVACGGADGPETPTGAAEATTSPTEVAAEPTELAEPEDDAESTNPVRIGVLNPTTGTLAVFGEQANQGIQLYFDNHEVPGAEVELVFADTAGDPQQALEQARRLVEQEQVDFLLGLINSAVAVPLAEFADEQEVPLVMAIAGARAATDGSHPYVFRTAMANGQQDRPLGWYAATAMGRTNVATFAWDFLVGEERTGGFLDTFTAAGGAVVSEQRPPLGTTDYGPFISQIDPEGVDLIYAFFSGPGAIAFSQQLSEFGITPDIPVVAPGYYTAGVLGEMGATADGLVQATQWSSTLDIAENRAFLDFYANDIGGEAGVYVEEGYLSAEVAARALEAVDSDLSDTQAFLDALAAVEFVGSAGPFRFAENGQSVRNVYITEVVLNDEGVPVQSIIETIEDVGLEWQP